MEIQIKTLTKTCGEECKGFMPYYNELEEEWKCSRLWLCEFGANAMLNELQTRFEHEEHEAFKKDVTGAKEHVVWNKAIRILEEYL